MPFDIRVVSLAQRFGLEFKTVRNEIKVSKRTYVTRAQYRAASVHDGSVMYIITDYGVPLEYENTNDPGTYSGPVLVEDTSDAGTYTIVTPGNVAEDTSNPGYYIVS